MLQWVEAKAAILSIYRIMPNYCGNINSLIVIMPNVHHITIEVEQLNTNDVHNSKLMGFFVGCQ